MEHIAADGGSSRDPTAAQCTADRAFAERPLPAAEDVISVDWFRFFRVAALIRRPECDLS